MPMTSNFLKRESKWMEEMREQNAFQRRQERIAANLENYAVGIEPECLSNSPQPPEIILRNDQPRLF